MTTFDVPGAYGTVATSINGKGDITGSYSINLYHSAGFVRWKDGTFAFINEEVDPTGINTKGEVTGEYYYRFERPDDRIGFVQKSGGQFKPFRVQSEKRITIVEGINDTGTVVGWINTKKRNGPYTSYGFIRSQ